MAPVNSVGFDGVTAMLTSAAGVTVTVAEPVTEPKDAVMSDEPSVSAVARPVLEMEATAGVAEVHVTCVVSTCVLASEYVPVATRLAVRPRGNEVVPLTAIDTSVGFVTVSVVLPETAPSVAMTVLLPAVSAVTRPSLPEALLAVATAGVPVVQVTCVVMSCVLESENVPVAVN